MNVADDSRGPITAGKVVTFRYTLTDPSGEVVDQSGEDGMAYLHGAGNIVPGLERAMDGHVVSDKFRAVVAPEDGYGERTAPIQKVPREAFPDDLQMEVGMQFVAQGPDGTSLPVWVVGVEGDSVQVDMNHPLAGMTLTFDIEVTAIRAATPEERTHGHPHGPGGHHHP